MINYSKVIINKNFLKRYLVEKEDISKSLSRFIDNSINAREEITTSENPCEVSMNIFENLIMISDNSGGIHGNLTDKEIFRIGMDKGENISGLGMKKSFFRLGNKIDIFSNRNGCSRKFSLDIKLGGEELTSQSENIDYNPEVTEGTNIFISDLDNNINKEIINSYTIDNILARLGRIYSKFIKKGELIILVNERKVTAKNIEAEKISSCKILGSYQVDLYKGSKDDISGIDLFINNYMIYNREKSKEEVKWNLLNEAKHTYTDCIVEISYYGEKLKFIENKEELFTEVIKFIKENKVYFESKTIIIQYEMPITKVEELKEYYYENTAKAIGIKAFNKLYEDFSYKKNN
ncbi:ATP-binding protein [Clostridium chromiireducens]|uniref:ATP-binding protein n=1 Tax=Clostridium chromiireducens TaxID=225345 RepID=A0A1V4I500_9CLOT|nr:ATP-binding protein [Clostridium chromiireducens]OPJ54647.1 hypothetical protein CLCHR_47990 [Clostridium chromiireducens]